MDTTTLVEAGAKLKAEIRTKQDALKEIEAHLIERGAGTYEGAAGESCTVIVPNPVIKPTADEIEAAREAAGDAADKLFTKVVSYAPVKAFREVVAALLSKAKAKKLIALCEKTSSPFVKWAK
jgi:threonine aldolase